MLLLFTLTFVRSRWSGGVIELLYAVRECPLWPTDWRHSECDNGFDRVALSNGLWGRSSSVVIKTVLPIALVSRLTEWPQRKHQDRGG